MAAADKRSSCEGTIEYLERAIDALQDAANESSDGKLGLSSLIRGARDQAQDALFEAEELLGELESED